MLKLMKLEWKKNRLSSYFKGLIICIISIFAAVSLMGWGSRNESEPMFPDYFEYMSLTNILIRIVFIIFSAVILSRIVIDEYRSKTIQLLFTYPLQRKKLIVAKLSIVFGFCFFSIILATTIINVLIYFLHPMLGFIEKPVRIDEIISTLPSLLISAFTMAGISLIPLYFGMRKKSNAAAITSAVLIGVLINATVTIGGSQTSLFQFIGVPIGFCLLGLFIGYLSFRKIDHLDTTN